MLERTPSTTSYRCVRHSTATMNGDIDKNESAVKEKKGKLKVIDIHSVECVIL